jgi:hypothetical protein
VLEVGIVPQVPTPSALPQTWTLKGVYKELGSATASPSHLAQSGVATLTLMLNYMPKNIKETPTSSTRDYKNAILSKDLSLAKRL